MKTQKLNLSYDCQPSIDLLSLRAITFGNSGAGKTGLGRVIFEESVAAGVPTGVIDLKGDWWGLKSSKSGNSDGLQVIIFGGDHADVPINENAGAEIANKWCCDSLERWSQWLSQKPKCRGSKHC